MSDAPTEEAPHGEGCLCDTPGFREAMRYAKVSAQARLIVGMTIQVIVMVGSETGAHVFGWHLTWTGLSVLVTASWGLAIAGAMKLNRTMAVVGSLILVRMARRARR